MEAKAHIEAALTIYQRTFGENHLRTSHCHRNLGRLFLLLDEPASALPHLQRAYEIRGQSLGEEHPLTRQVYADLSALT